MWKSPPKQGTSPKSRLYIEAPSHSTKGINMIVNGPGISFTEPDIGSEFVPPIPEHPREKIVALC